MVVVPEKYKKIFKSLLKIPVYYGRSIWGGASIFFKENGTFSSASVSFYIVLGAFPLVLLVITLIGEALGDYSWAQTQILELLEIGFPSLGETITENLAKVMEFRLVGKSTSKIFNICILCLSSFSLFQAFFKGIFNITRDEHFKLAWYNLESLMGVALVILFLIGIFVFPTFLAFLVNIAEGEIITSADLDILPFIDSIRSFTSWVNLSGSVNLLVKANIIHGIFSLLFLMYIYKWMFRKKIKNVDAFCGSITFVFIFIAGKWLYFYYLLYAKANLARNYGDFYTLIVAMLWIYFLTNSFFLGACISYSSLRKSSELEEKTKACT